jgi:acyl carrier protein
VVAERLGLEPFDLTPGLSLADDLAADSLDRLELAMAIEAAFGVEMPDRAWAAFRTYGDLADRVTTMVGACARLDEAAAPHVRLTAEIVRAGLARAVVRSGRLTPYAIETMIDDLRGRELVGAVEVEVGGADAAAMRALEEGLLRVR